MPSERSATPSGVAAPKARQRSSSSRPSRSASSRRSSPASSGAASARQLQNAGVRMSHSCSRRPQASEILKRLLRPSCGRAQTGSACRYRRPLSCCRTRTAPGEHSSAPTAAARDQHVGERAEPYGGKPGISACSSALAASASASARDPRSHQASARNRACHRERRQRPVLLAQSITSVCDRGRVFKRIGPQQDERGDPEARRLRPQVIQQPASRQRATGELARLGRCPLADCVQARHRERQPLAGGLRHAVGHHETVASFAQAAPGWKARPRRCPTRRLQPQTLLALALGQLVDHRAESGDRLVRPKAEEQRGAQLAGRLGSRALVREPIDRRLQLPERGREVAAPQRRHAQLMRDHGLQLTARGLSDRPAQEGHRDLGCAAPVRACRSASEELTVS